MRAESPNQGVAAGLAAGARDAARCALALAGFFACACASALEAASRFAHNPIRASGGLRAAAPRSNHLAGFDRCQTSARPPRALAALVTCVPEPSSGSSRSRGSGRGSRDGTVHGSGRARVPRARIPAGGRQGRLQRRTDAGAAASGGRGDGRGERDAVQRNVARRCLLLAQCWLDAKLPACACQLLPP